VTDETDPLAQFGLDAIDLRWTLKDIASKRTWLINQDHVAKLIELGLVEMRGRSFRHRSWAKHNVGVIPSASQTPPLGKRKLKRDHA
jgi:hypothetical protein